MSTLMTNRGLQKPPVKVLPLLSFVHLATSKILLWPLVKTFVVIKYNSWNESFTQKEFPACYQLHDIILSWIADYI